MRLSHIIDKIMSNKYSAINFNNLNKWFGIYFCHFTSLDGDAEYYLRLFEFVDFTIGKRKKKIKMVGVSHIVHEIINCLEMFIKNRCHPNASPNATNTSHMSTTRDGRCKGVASVSFQTVSCFIFVNFLVRLFSTTFLYRPIRCRCRLLFFVLCIIFGAHLLVSMIR